MNDNKEKGKREHVKVMAVAKVVTETDNTVRHTTPHHTTDRTVNRKP